MVWAKFHKVGVGIKVPNNVLEPELMKELTFKTGGDTWPLPNDNSLVLLSTINVATVIMRPNCVPVPSVKEFIKPMSQKNGRHRVDQAMVEVFPKQVWPTKHELEALKQEVVALLGHPCDLHWFERSMVMQFSLP